MNSENPDQTARMGKLIRAIVGCIGSFTGVAALVFCNVKGMKKNNTQKIRQINIIILIKNAELHK